MKDKLTRFAEMLKVQRIEGLRANGLDCEANVANCETNIKPGSKYTKVDIGGSGVYMVVNETGEIFGIKAYGVIHKGHAFGTLDTVDQWDWSGYRGKKRQVDAAIAKAKGETQ